MVIKKYFKKDWIYFNLLNLFLINCSYYKRTFNKAKKAFKYMLKRKFFFGKRKNLPILYINPSGKIISINMSDVQWKDKYDTPRFEENPYFIITLFNKFSFGWIWHAPSDEYWEQILWYLYYCDKKSIVKNDNKKEVAKETWPWLNMKNEPTWSDEYLK